MKKHLLILIPVIFLAYCSSSEEEKASDAFWERLQSLCGNAYAGGLAHAEEGFDLLSGNELTVAHFRECEGDTLKIPFHIETAPGVWDRSRTWVLYRHSGNLELRHDHRNEDGTEEEQTWYGGFSMNEGTRTYHEFEYPPRTQELGVPVGWRLYIQPDQRFTYGTILNGEWTFRVDFDIQQKVTPPPAPWGHE